MNTLNTWNPIRDLDVLTNRLFGHSLLQRDGQREVEPQLWSPRVDIIEDEQAYRVVADLPQVPKDAVKVSVENGMLTIRGERKWEKLAENTKVHLIERSYGTFTRHFRLPEDGAGDKLSASYKEGVLTIILPKREETKPRQVEVEVK
jgi:HSP20 family protein